MKDETVPDDEDLSGMINLTLIHYRLLHNTYATIQDYVDDMQRLCEVCYKVYADPGHGLKKAAREMEKQFIRLLVERMEPMLMHILLDERHLIEPNFQQ